jgi:hypothetical protein
LTFRHGYAEAGGQARTANLDHGFTITSQKINLNLEDTNFFRFAGGLDAKVDPWFDTQLNVGAETVA